MKTVCITVDIEQDCPPFLNTMQGVEAGMPKLLALFKAEAIKATFFTTGQVAEAYPKTIQRVVAAGHELGCHGYTHKRFDHMTYTEAENEIATAALILRRFSDQVIAFRAPNLRFPDEFLPILKRHNFTIDASGARYKAPRQKHITHKHDMWCIPASITSSFLRLPRWLIYTQICRLDPLVLFVHPWEFVDMSKTGIRWDCRFNTGEKALMGLRDWIIWLKKNCYQFVQIKQLIFDGSV